MKFLRLPALAIVLAAAVFSISQDGAAGSLNIVSITIEPDWEGGYMGLGGGLVKSIVKSDDDKPAISGRRPRHVRATQKSIVKSDDDKPAISGRRPRHVRQRAQAAR